jgi:hypothetical protein
MTRNLETADKIAKLTLSGATIALYFFDVIGGPFAKALVVLSAVVVSIYFIKSVFVKHE